MLGLVDNIIVIHGQCKYYEFSKENELEGLKKSKQIKKTSKLDFFKGISDERIKLGCTAIAIFNYVEKKAYEGNVVNPKS